MLPFSIGYPFSASFNRVILMFFCCLLVSVCLLLLLLLWSYVLNRVVCHHVTHCPCCTKTVRSIPPSFHDIFDREKLTASKVELHSGKSKSGRKRGKRHRNNKPKNVQMDPLGGIVHNPVVKSGGGAVEIKTLDYSNAQNTMSDTSALVALLNGSIQGLDAINDRIGRKIVIKRVLVRINISYSSTNLSTSTGINDQSDVIRFVIVFDKQTNSALASYGTIFNTSGAYNAPLAFRNVSFIERFIVLCDKTFSVGVTGPNCHAYTFDCPCSLAVQYGSTNNGDVTDIISGSIAAYCADTNVNANLPGHWSIGSRCEFTDS